MDHRFHLNKSGFSLKKLVEANKFDKNLMERSQNDHAARKIQREALKSARIARAPDAHMPVDYWGDNLRIENPDNDHLKFETSLKRLNNDVSRITSGKETKLSQYVERNLRGPNKERKPMRFVAVSKNSDIFARDPICLEKSTKSNADNFI